MMNRLKTAMFLAMIPTFFFSCGPSGKQQEGKEVDSTANTQTEEINVEIRGEEVSYSGDSIKMEGYIAYDPSKEEKRPGILIVHEWWGHNDYTRKRADMLAELGYTALAVDMYGDGKKAEHPDDAGKFSGKVMSDLPGAKDRFEAAMEVLKNHPSVDNSQIAAIGYCFGGGVVLHMARMGMPLEGVVSFHGSLGTKMEVEPGSISADILVLHGAADPFVPQETVEAFKNEMNEANADMTFVEYEGAKHAFTNPDATQMGEKFDLPLEYNQEADEKSWERMKEFFTKIFE